MHRPGPAGGAAPAAEPGDDLRPAAAGGRCVAQLSSTVPCMTSYRQPGTVLTDLSFTVPLDHARPDGEQIQIFAREVVAADKAGADLPWLVYLQGGPGFGALRPAGRESWLDRALNDYRVLLLDQRGTGRLLPGQPAHPGRASAAPAGAGRLPGAVPGRLDRGRRRADPQAAHRRAPVEHPRPELRRLLRRHLPVARARGPARGAHHRRPARPGHVGRRRLPGDVPAGGAEERRALRALPGRCGAGDPDRPAAGGRRRAAAQRRAADRRGLPVARPDAGLQHRQPRAALPAGRPVRRRRPLRRLPVPGAGAR